MINPQHLISCIIRPVLYAMDMHSESAERLILGTIAVESNCGQYLRQKNDGPALGICQIEPKTAQDLLYRYLIRRDDIDVRFQRAFQVVNDIKLKWDNIKLDAIEIKLISDLRFSVGLCRLRYWVVPKPLPDPDDIAGLAQYWKTHYNTQGGAGAVAKYVQAWDVYCRNKFI